MTASSSANARGSLAAAARQCVEPGEYHRGRRQVQPLLGSASPGRVRYVGSGPTNSIPYSLQACSIVEPLIVVSGDGAVIAR